MRATTRRRSNREGGVIMIATAIIFVLMLPLIALLVDGSRAALVKDQLESAALASARAAVFELYKAEGELLDETDPEFDWSEDGILLEDYVSACRKGDKANTARQEAVAAAALYKTEPLPKQATFGTTQKVNVMLAKAGAREPIALEQNLNNDADGDIVVEPSTLDPQLWSAVVVTARRSASPPWPGVRVGNNPLGVNFAGMFHSASRPYGYTVLTVQRRVRVTGVPASEVGSTFTQEGPRLSVSLLGLSLPAFEQIVEAAGEVVKLQLIPDEPAAVLERPIFPITGFTNRLAVGDDAAVAADYSQPLTNSVGRVLCIPVTESLQPTVYTFAASQVTLKYYTPGEPVRVLLFARIVLVAIKDEWYTPPPGPVQYNAAGEPIAAETVPVLKTYAYFRAFPSAVGTSARVTKRVTGAYDQDGTFSAWGLTLAAARTHLPEDNR